MTHTRHGLRFHVTTAKTASWRYAFVRCGDCVRSFRWRVGTVRSDRIEAIAIRMFLQGRCDGDGTNSIHGPGNPGAAAASKIYITSDGRKWKPCDNGTHPGEVRQLVNGYMQ